MCRREADFRCITHDGTRRRTAAELPFGRSRTGNGRKKKHKDSRSDYTFSVMLLELGRPVNASLLVLPSCQSLTRALSLSEGSEPTILCATTLHAMLHPGVRCGTSPPASTTFSLKSTYTSSRLPATSQAKRATYTPHRFILSVFHLLRKFLRSGFFSVFFCVSLLPTIPHTRD